MGANTTVRYHHLPIICLKFKRLTTANSHEKMKKMLIITNHLVVQSLSHV